MATLPNLLWQWNHKTAQGVPLGWHETSQPLQKSIQVAARSFCMKKEVTAQLNYGKINIDF